MRFRFYLLVCWALLLGACADDPVGLPVSETPVHKVGPVQLAQGEKLYQENCASCHGVKAEGDVSWRQPNADGNFPPPPLNGTGHAWHHSAEVLKSVIREGSLGGKGTMPGWAGELSEQEMDAVISWFQSLWDKQVYATWYEMQQRDANETKK
jgi:mono/diheme cytochrome c family protein